MPKIVLNSILGSWSYDRKIVHLQTWETRARKIMAASTTVLPNDWPQEAENEFERIRVLGQGAFGQVFLAKLKSSASSKEEEYAAIKGVGITNEKEERTADREIAILQEMNHPNIIRLVRSYEPVPNASGRYLALSYVPGKDVGQILEGRGALALPLAQLIARHLISAVAYLHVRGVMHRDVKPDNIMLKGWTDHYMWAEEETIQEAVESGKFSAILVDFGFARATRKADYVATERDNIERRSTNSFSSINRSGNRIHLSSMRAYSRRVFRTMSAVGTANFAAPEILSTIREQRGSSCLTECVSSYSLISDAYAVGATLNEVLTGVPPGEEVESYVKANRKDDDEEEEPSSAEPAKKSFFSCCSTVAVVEPKPRGANTICLRCMHELPKPAHDLIVKLMQENAEKRLSVRDAQEHEWIGGYDSLPHGDYPAHTNDPIVFVKNEAAFV